MSTSRRNINTVISSELDNFYKSGKWIYLLYETIALPIPYREDEESEDNEEEQEVVNEDNANVVQSRRLKHNGRTVRFLVSTMHADVDVLDSRGRTPLTSACTTAAPVYLVSCLLELGSRVNVASNDGWTALDFTIRDRVFPQRPVKDAEVEDSDDDTGGEHCLREQSSAMKEEKVLLLLQAGAESWMQMKRRC